MPVEGSKVGIIGGSIAGCATAIAMQRVGCEVTVLERSSEGLKDRGDVGNRQMHKGRKGPDTNADPPDKSVVAVDIVQLPTKPDAKGTAKLVAEEDDAIKWLKLQ